MPYTHLFFDLDHTLWDFDSNCRHTLQELYIHFELEKRGIHDFNLLQKSYFTHNKKLWDRYRKGYIKADILRAKRMWLTLQDFKIPDEELAMDMAERFLDLLPSRTMLFPHTIELLTYLSDKNYRLHVITNGFETIQYGKLKNSGIDHFFTEVITSEGSNSMKPNKEIFEYAFQKAKALPEESIMIGDNLEVDIRGGRKAGMDQVHVNHTNIPAGKITPTYTVYSLEELKEIF